MSSTQTAEETFKVFAKLHNIKYSKAFNIHLNNNLLEGLAKIG